MHGIGPTILKYCAPALTLLLYFYLLLVSNTVFYLLNGKCTVSCLYSNQVIKTIWPTIDPYLFLCTILKLLECIMIKSPIANSLLIASHFLSFMKNWLTLVLQQMLVFLSNIYESIKVQVDVIDILSWLCQGFQLGSSWRITVTTSVSWHPQWYNYSHGSSLICDQCVHENGSSSDYLTVSSGVPQGNISGPLVFLVYLLMISCLPQFRLSMCYYLQMIQNSSWLFLTIVSYCT